MRTLLIEDPALEKPAGTRAVETTLALIQAKLGGETAQVASLQRAIEAMEVEGQEFDLIVCDYRGGSRSLVKCFLAVSSDCPCVLLISEEDDISELLLVSRNAVLETVPRPEVPAALDQILARFRESFAETSGKDDDFFRVDTEGFELKGPLWADIYVRLAPNRYCRRFKKQDGFDLSDLQASFRSRGITEFYVRKDQTDALFENQMERLNAWHGVAEPKPGELLSSLSSSLEIVKDAVHRIGFTPEVQSLAKKSVNVMLRSIGNSPKLSPILTRLRKSRGKYITSHSMMLAEISCAIAQSIGWGEPTVFMKLCFASFIHDLPLNDNRVARFQNLQDLKDSGADSEEVHRFRLHPIQAAEYAAQFQGIPSDVDIILLQHHELPDGSGFPRGLNHQQTHPLSCIFNLSHDLLCFFLEQIPVNDRSDMLRIFLERNTAKYGHGFFHKIWQSLDTGVPLKADQS